MMKKTILFNDFLLHNGLIDDVYKSMSDPDLSVIVMKMFDILHLINSLPVVITKQSKSESKSTEFRNEGNRAYARNKFQSALICYNKALLYAPKDSRALKLAYSNRSALLHKVNALSACLNDINTCFSLGCPLDIIEKLRTRKDDANSKVWAETLAECSVRSVFCEDYFKMIEPRNPQIPCASMDVGVIIENDVPKIVATTDIKVGTPIAMEKAFVGMNDPSNARFACYYCHKMQFNLQPCEGCCYALFCSKTCRDKCMLEYHDVECQIIDMLNQLTLGTSLRLSLLAVLKMKHMCGSWSEIIAASRNMGLSRVKTSSINEIYDSKSKFSLLNVKDERHFLHGPMYNSSINCAFIVYYLESVPGFYPQLPEERDEARRAVGRLLLFLSLYTTTTLVVPSVTVKKREKTEFYDTPNFGWFSFFGKLNSSCDANVLVVGLNNAVGLVAQQPIKRGSELSVSYVGHWLDRSGRKRSVQTIMLTLNGTACNCSFCIRDSLNITTVDELTDVQRKHYNKLNIAELKERFNVRNLPEILTKVCKVLAILSSVPFSEEYGEVYRFFRQCFLYFQNVNSSNCILDYE